ncbi:ATP-binding protein [Actinocatenispora comari]|uniref:Cell division protein FtsK n=1 Tax=Actinocatenispora comari TaxID=2807577 RepID=A0A8J4AG00_9ACTN|nr:AAA family ATPase [Actinocatenispora comari]GIL29944.1 cell division protein FtsK [Actinocatenispora comari]
MTHEVIRVDGDAEAVEYRPGQPGAPVDGPDERRPLHATIRAREAEPRRPLVPGWTRNADQRREVARWAVGYAGYTVAFHTLRAPKYAAKTAAWSVVGAGRLVARQLRWWFVADSVVLQQEAATANDPETWMRLHDKARQARLFRGLVLLAELLGLVAGGLLARFLAPWWVPALVGLVAVPALALAGRPAHRPILDRVSVGPRFIKLTADQVRRALVATGKVRDEAAPSFPRDIGRDGPGWLASVELPSGVIATDIIDKREQLAGGLRLPFDQVWPEAVKGEHPGRLDVWVADRPVSAMRQPASPLLDEALQLDYFQPMPYGFDVRMREVTWSLEQRNSVFGGQPGSGKTLAARNVALGAVLDPLVIPLVSELKGSGDWDCFEPLCPPGGYVCGATTAATRATVAMLEYLLTECEIRPDLIARYARQGLNSVKALNRRMAERDERLRPIVAVFDEVQEAITDPEHGKQVAAMLTSLVKRGRALGVHLVLATQRLDKDSLPKGITSNVSNRACLSVPGQVECDMVLGTGAYKQGARPNAFQPIEDAGWMVVAGLGTGFGTRRAAYLDDRAAAAICARAEQLRHGVDRPDPIRAEARNLLADVREVWPGGDAVWSEVVVPLLAERWPDAYADLTVEQFGSLMASAGVRTVDIGRRIDGRQTTRKGVRLDALDAGITARQLKS